MDENVHASTLLLVSKPAFYAVVWTGVVVSFLFLAFRIYVRVRCFRKVYDDDFFVVLAWLVLLATAIIWPVNRTLATIYEGYGIVFGGQKPTEAYLAHFENALYQIFAETFLNICGLWCVKLSFLAFFRRLGYHVRGQRVLWWSVLAATIAGWAISIGVIYYPCALATLEYEAAHCGTPSAGAAIRRSYRIQIGVDFSTDFLIAAIPVNLLWYTKINLRQKVALLALFLLTIITMVFAIVRVEVALRGSREDDSWFYLCTCIELTISIIVTCLISYRPLFTKDLRTGSSRRYHTGAVRLRENPSMAYMESTATKADGKHSESSSRHYHEEAVPLDASGVRSDYTVTSP